MLPQPRLVRIVRCLLGLVLLGAGLGLTVAADLGVSPWDVLHQGLAERLGISIGTASIGVGIIVLLGWIPLRERPGVGTLMNADQSVIDIPADDIVLEELEHWTSPHTGRRYAVRWRVSVASLGVDVGLDRVMDDQELDTQQLPRVIYWEGMCRLTGTLAGQPAAGYAFIELANQFD